jgi:predicted aspartyl protease
MKYLIFFLFIQPMHFNSIAQTINLNQGETTQKGYFSIVKFENVGGFIIVKAAIKGTTYRFLLDTGTPNAISKTLYEKLKPSILSNEKMMDANGVLNEAKMVNIEELTIGNVVFNNIPTVILEDFMSLECMQIDGFIGSNMLRNSIIQVSYTDETLILTDTTTQLNLSENHATKMAFFDEQSSPYIEITLRGEVEGNDWVQFDTGFTGFYDINSAGYDSIFSKYPILKLENTGYGGNSMSVWGFNEAKRYKLTAPELILNGATFLNVSTQSSTDDKSRIGHDLLKYGKVTVDYRHQKFYFELYKNPIDLAKKEFPISPKFEGNKLLVGTIWGEKYAQLINVGDQILSIDGINCEKINPCELILKGSLFDNKDRAQLLIKTKTDKIVTVFMERE